MGRGNNSGRNPTRRNRNIGTAKSGSKRQSEYGIPHRWNDQREYYELLEDHVEVVRQVHGRDLRFFIEPVQRGLPHHCTPDDVAKLLGMLPSTCLAGPDPLAAVVMRQPTRKQSEQSPVWGSIIYQTSMANLDGPVVFIDANVSWWTMGFGRKMNVEAQGEFERARAVLGEPGLMKRSHQFECGFPGLRRWLLYHTLIHEIGHYMDYRQTVVLPAQEGEDREAKYAELRARPSSQREAFAHRFSDEWRDELVHQQRIPFEHQFDGEGMMEEGLDPIWFFPRHEEDHEAGPPIGTMFRDRRKPMFAYPGWRDVLP